MNYTLAPLVIFAFSLVFVLLGAWVLLRQQWLLQWLKGTAGLLMVGLAVYLSLFALNIYGYREYAQEVSVATVSFRQSGEQSFIATVTRTDGTTEDFRLKGDQWQLDARIIKWKLPFSLLGLQPGYQLDRISGRYYALEDERSRDRTVYSLHRDPVGIDVWEMARDGWISCASCHLDGGHDGRTWVLEDGPRNTTPIRGLSATFPFHWSGDRVDLFDFQRTIREVQFGAGLSEEENSRLAAFLAFAEVPASPHPVDAAARRGEQVFAEAGCATCHSGAALTDGLVHDVGTGSAAGEMRGPSFDTPTLLGLHDTAPYLHDGSAPTLADVFAAPEGPHSLTGFTEEDVAALVAHLRTLPRATS